MATSSGGGLPMSMTLITAGAVMVYTAFKGVSVVDLFAGDLPKTTPTPGPDTQPESLYRLDSASPTGVYRGAWAARLYGAELVARTRFKLRITDRCRPQNAGYGAPNSKHKTCRAFDAAGSDPTDMAAFARWADSMGFQVFHDPVGLVAPGYPHDDHVHVGDPNP